MLFFFMVQWVGLLYVNIVFPDHTHLLTSSLSHHRHSFVVIVSWATWKRELLFGDLGNVGYNLVTI